MTVTIDYIPTTYQATDGYMLKGRHYKSDRPKGLIIIGSATGVPQGFYQKFAQFAVANQFDVVTFDYRGIGESAPDSLKGFKMDYRDWARKDLQAVIEQVEACKLPLYYMGHSYGGHALGLIDNHEKIKAAYFFGAGAGWHGWMPFVERVKVTIMWNVVAPIMTRIQGYLGWSVIGMGEDLPLGVYKQWKRWCHFPYYFFEDPKYPHMKDQFSKVKVPIKAVTATDDLWAMPRSRDAFMRHYTQSDLAKEDINPEHAGISQIGHMGYFRGAASGLWMDVLAFYENR